jgi:hypothetical protein
LNAATAVKWRAMNQNVVAGLDPAISRARADARVDPRIESGDAHDGGKALSPE